MFFRPAHLLFIVAITGCSYLPFSSDKASAPAHAIQEDEEAKISRQFRREARKQLTLITNPEIEGYVDHIGRRLLSVMGPQAFAYRFFVVADPSLNAFSVPGGSVYMYTGLLETAKNTAEV